MTTDNHELVEITIPGTPTAKGRPRFTGMRTYTDAKTKAAEQSILAAWLVQTSNRQPHDGEVYVEADFTFRPADSWPKWKRQLALAGEWPHTAKPDLDNLVKILDGLNGVAWLDDSQITAVRGAKQYGPVAHTLIRIYFLTAPTKPTTHGRKTQ